MKESVIFIHKIIIILKIIASRIIRRINVDNVNFTLVSFFQQFQCSKVITFNQKILFTAVING